MGRRRGGGGRRGGGRAASSPVEQRFTELTTSMQQSLERLRGIDTISDFSELQRGDVILYFGRPYQVVNSSRGVPEVRQMFTPGATTERLTATVRQSRFPEGFRQLPRQEVASIAAQGRELRRITPERTRLVNQRLSSELTAITSITARRELATNPVFTERVRRSGGDLAAIQRAAGVT